MCSPTSIDKPKCRNQVHVYITLVLDGVDLTAKESYDGFITLVNLTKHLTDGGNVKVVLVSSEGQIQSLVQEMSSESRAAHIVEILDLRYNFISEKLVEVKNGFTS